MSVPSRIRGVLFDYGLVLTGPPDPAAHQRMKSALHATEEPFSTAYWAHRPAYDRGTLSGRAYWQAVAADLHATLTPATLATLLAADTTLWTVPNQPMIDWALALHAAGLRLGILSNLGDEMEAGVTAAMPWLAYFHHRTFSHRLRLLKPEPAIYLHAAAGLHLPPSEILFIDDREENIRGAQAVGMTALRYTTHAAFLDRLKTIGLASITAPQT